MPPVGPPEIVDAPATEAPRFGLFSVAVMPETTGTRWQSGVTWENEAGCEPANGYAIECVEPDESPGATPVGFPLELRDGGDIPEASPFAVYGTYRCKAMSHSRAVAQDRASANLLAWEERSVERHIMLGDLGNTPTFQGATVLGGGPIDPALGVDLLEGWLATNVAGVGALHVPRSLTGTFGSSDLFHREGTHLETGGGSYVVLGGGYDMPNTSPAGADAPDGSRWVYATGRPTVRRSEVFYTPSESNRVNTEDNDLSVIAHRLYVIGWDCDVAAVQVVQGCCGSGGG